MPGRRSKTSHGQCRIESEAALFQHRLMPVDPLLSTPRLMEVCHVAHRLNTGEAYVRRLIRAGELKAIRFGKQLRVDAADLQAFIEAHRIPHGTKGSR